jgi:hypothetical protein
MKGHLSKERSEGTHLRYPWILEMCVSVFSQHRMASSLVIMEFVFQVILR